MEAYESGSEDDPLMQTSVLTGILTSAGLTSNDSDSFAASTVNTTVVADAGEELFEDYSAVLLHFASLCCIVFIIVGIPGNLITIIALFRCKKVRNCSRVVVCQLAMT
jgi:hypothetical protein